MSKSQAANDGWREGVIAGYQSVRGRGVSPSIPSRPGTYPSNVISAQDVYDYFYKIGFERGVEKAR